MKVLVTGAHFTVAQAVIEELQKYPNMDIVYVGRKTTMEGDSSLSAESQILPLLGVKFIPITAGRFQRSFSIYTIPSVFKIPLGFLQAFWIILKEKPNVLLSFGGYVAVPLVFISWLFSIPIIIHEQTLVAGLANKISGFFATKIAVSFKENYPYPKEKTVLTGNPIRKEIQDKESTSKNKIPVILITGGNQGSHVINLAIEECLEDLLKICQIIHQTGDSKFKDYERLKNNEGANYKVYKWIDNMGEVALKSDLVISRAGINTLTELAYLSKPALVIPIPYLYKDEQNKNAEYFVKTGMVKILPQSKLSGKELLKNIQEMLSNLNAYKSGARLASGLIIKDGAKRVALETILLVCS